MPVVDVRDVAQAHLQAIKVEEAKNKRFILAADCLWFKDFAEVLKQKYPNFNVQTGEIGYWMVKIVSWFDNLAKHALPIWNKTLRVDHSLSVQVLGIKYINPNESIVAMAESLFNAGMIERK